MRNIINIEVSIWKLVREKANRALCYDDTPSVQERAPLASLFLLYRVSQKKVSFWNFRIGNAYGKFGPFWTMSDNFGPFLHFGLFWTDWTILDSFYHSGPFWTVLDHLDRFDRSWLWVQWIILHVNCYHFQNSCHCPTFDPNPNRQMTAFTNKF